MSAVGAILRVRDSGSGVVYEVCRGLCPQPPSYQLKQSCLDNSTGLAIPWVPAVNLGGIRRMSSDRPDPRKGCSDAETTHQI